MTVALQVFFVGTFTLRMEITLQLLLVFFLSFQSSFITSQLRYLFVRCSYVFYDDRVTLDFGTFELCMEVPLQLHFFLLVIVTYFL